MVTVRNIHSREQGGSFRMVTLQRLERRETDENEEKKEACPS